MKGKVCRACKFLHNEDSCPSCGSTQEANSAQGRLHVLNLEKSFLAKELEITKEGEYAIKIR